MSFIRIQIIKLNIFIEEVILTEDRTTEEERMHIMNGNVIGTHL